ncbi:MAG: FAD-binding oxidoreductase [Actinocatenispora sp.]
MTRDGSTERTPAWNGWTREPGPPLSVAVRRELHRLLGLPPGLRTPSVPRDEVRLPESALPAAVLRQLESAIGADRVRTGRDERIAHAAGRSYLDLVRLRAGDADAAPDAVVHPADADQIRSVLAICAAADVAVVPFGGGTSVVGGVAGERGGHRAALTLDLDDLDQLVDVDPTSQTATLQAGMRGPAVESALATHGFTLGHFPQSYQYATVGGWVATRSAGQASTGYGRIDDLVHGLVCVTPTGDLRLGRGPASAAGPRLLDLVVGSEGTLGIITEATLAVRPVPAARRYAGWSLPDLPAGLAACRALAQRLGPGLAPDVCRLSDPDETHTTMLLAGGSLSTRLGRGYLALRGHRAGCLLILGWEGDADSLRYRQHAATRLLRAHGGVTLGAAPGRSWLHGRFDGPKLRDRLLEHGMLVETLETAADWSALPALYDAIRDSLRGSLGRVLVLTHVSHLYRTGASLYVTVLAVRDGADPVGQWSAAKQAVTKAITAHAGTVTHHHAVGADHRAFLEGEIGATGVELLRAAKSAVDPSGILNPGKLIPDRPS